ncbi:SUMF1/EgtB/PvdO family nonheme iron enzyme [Saccharopolyspora sp. NPDC050389]|uniref:formylglycine-generating enzyme family protein n=1 Tax=Saccharopolyspora sp. NPDC050389 TaxID=3155516 RepID=UPI0034100EFA
MALVLTAGQPDLGALQARPGVYPCDTATGDVVCDWASEGYRLPTEAEWQYACKAGTTGYRYGEIDAVAWYVGNSGGRANDVGGKAPNAWGLHDTLGNVWEWCRGLRRGGLRLDHLPQERLGRVPAGGATVRRRSHPTFAIDDLGSGWPTAGPADARSSVRHDQGPRLPRHRDGYLELALPTSRNPPLKQRIPHRVQPVDSRQMAWHREQGRSDALERRRNGLERHRIAPQEWVGIANSARTWLSLGQRVVAVL